jgi:hypothetical protein
VAICSSSWSGCTKSTAPPPPPSPPSRLSPLPHFHFGLFNDPFYFCAGGAAVR